MTKREFLEMLGQRLDTLPESERKETLDYYAEMLDEMTEDGMSEEEAIASLPDMDEISDDAHDAVPLSVLDKEIEMLNRETRHKRLKTALVVIGSPLWLALIIAALGVIIAVYAAIWSVLIALYATAFAVCISAGALLGMFVGSFFVGGYTAAQSFLFLGAALISAGAGILLILLSIKATGWITALSKLFGRSIKKLFVKKEAAE